MDGDGSSLSLRNSISISGLRSILKLPIQHQEEPVYTAPYSETESPYTNMSRGGHDRAVRKQFGLDRGKYAHVEIDQRSSKINFVIKCLIVAGVLSIAVVLGLILAKKPLKSTPIGRPTMMPCIPETLPLTRPPNHWITRIGTILTNTGFNIPKMIKDLEMEVKENRNYCLGSGKPPSRGGTQCEYDQRRKINLGNGHLPGISSNDSTHSRRTAVGVAKIITSSRLSIFCDDREYPVDMLTQILTSEARKIKESVPKNESSQASAQVIKRYLFSIINLCRLVIKLVDP